MNHKNQDLKKTNPQNELLKNKQRKFSTWYFIVALFILCILEYMFYASQIVKVPYSDFKTLLHAGKLSDIHLSKTGVTATLTVDGLEGLLSPEKIQQIKQIKTEKHHIESVRIEDPDFIKELDKAKVQYSGMDEYKWLGSILSWTLPLIILLVFWSFLFRRLTGSGGFLEVGKSKARIYMEKETGVSFEDVAGVDEAKEELVEIVEFLKNPKSYGRLGARMPKGVILVGPPGTGKTLLARAVAGEAGVPFFSISGSEFVELFVGVGAARVRDLFDQARKMAPAIIFIDELDALGRARASYPISSGHDEKEQTLNQLLSEMDGFDPSVGLVLLAATNRPEILDPALLRAGRFDRHILVDRPDKVGRIAILNIYLKKIPQASNVDAEKIAALTPGFSGADLANLVNEAALLATRHKAKTVTLEDFNQAIERMVAGLEKKNRILNETERRTVAYHEMGHALIALSLPGSEKVHKVSIIPRGIGSLGYTIQRPTEDRYLMTQEELQNKMVVLLGGRAAEQVVFGHYSTGASDDLAKVTNIARSMVMHYGMYKPLGHIVFEPQNQSFLQPTLPASQERNFSEETAKEIDRAIRDIVKDAFRKAIEIIKEHQEQLEKGAKLLLDQETLSEEDLEKLMKIKPQRKEK